MAQVARAGLAGLGLGLAMAVAAPAASAAAAASASVAWSTYLRAGPGETYAAVDELEHDARVAVMGCDARWCQVFDGAARGYVDRDALDLPRTLAPQPPSAGPCVLVTQADDRKPLQTRFCSAPPPKG